MSVYAYLPGAYRDDNACVLQFWDDGNIEKALKEMKEISRWLQRISDFCRDAPDAVKKAIGTAQLPDTCGLSAAPVCISPNELAELAEGTGFNPKKPCLMQGHDLSSLLQLGDDDFRSYVHENDFRSPGERGGTLEVTSSGHLWVETPLDEYDEDAGTACALISLDDLAELLKPVLEARQDEGGSPRP